MNRLKICVATFALISASTTSTGLAVAQSLTENLYACAEKSDASDRLACFDAAVAALKGAEDRGEIATVTAEEVTEAVTEDFGLASPRAADVADRKLAAKQLEDAAEVEEITAGVVSIKRNALDKLVVELDNGQVWEQTDSREIPVSLKRPPTEATVKKAAFGSFRLKMGRLRPIRVDRVE